MEDVGENGDEEEDILAYTAIPRRQLSFAGSEPVAYYEE